MRLYFYMYIYSSEEKKTARLLLKNLKSEKTKYTVLAQNIHIEFLLFK